MAAEHASYVEAYKAGDDGSATAAAVLNCVISEARSLNVAPDALHGIVRAVVEVRPSSWDALVDTAAEAAGAMGIGLDAFETMLSALQAHLQGRDSYDEMRSDPEFVKDLAGQRGARAQRLASMRVADAARRIGG